MWKMETAEPHIYQRHMKDLEYKKKALIANEKNIFKEKKPSRATLNIIESTQSLESVRSQRVYKNSKKIDTKQKRVSKMQSNNLNILTVGDHSREATNDGATADGTVDLNLDS